MKNGSKDIVLFSKYFASHKMFRPLYMRNPFLKLFFIVAQLIAFILSLVFSLPCHFSFPLFPWRLLSSPLFEMRPFLLLLSSLSACLAYKMVIIAPAMANSQVMFNKRVAEALAAAGHDVTIALILAMEGLDYSDVKISKNVKILPVNASTGITKKQMEEGQAEFTFADVSAWDSKMRAKWTEMVEMLQLSCRKTLQNKEFMKWLKESKFDLAFVHMYQACPMGLAHEAGIPFVWLNSGGLMDFVSNTIGVPLPSSYVPPNMMAAHDTMTFFERIKSFIGHRLMAVMWPRMMANPETEIFREELKNPNFPNLLDIARNCSLVMVNSNDLYDLPRPTLAKVVNIGGLGAQLKDAKPLPEDLEKFIQKGEGAVVFSFGSVAPIHKAPESWKTAFLEAFARVPEYQFVMRYMADDLNDRLPPNVKLMKWLPQSDLLQHPRVKAFISHGGYNGMQETIAAGKPIIMIPLFGDQPKNAKIGEKHGIARILQKSEVTGWQLESALREILSQPSYTASARRLSQMVQKQPVPAEQLLVRWAELLAEFKHLDNLAPAGQKLNAFQYHSLDVISALSAALLLTLLLLFFILRFLFRLVLRLLGFSHKKDKHE